MPSIINASAANTGIIQTADASGILQLQANGVASLTVQANAAVSINNNLSVGGRITMTSQPAFLAGINSNTDATVTSGTAIVANTTQYNIGNHYSTSTGRFTAPVAGLYNFTLGVYFTNSGSNTQAMTVGVRKNGSFINGGSDNYGRMKVTPNNFSDGNAQFVLNVQFLLAAGDYVDVAPLSTSLRHYQGHFWFQGYLIG